MKFSSEIVSQVLKELEKVPNIRYVSSKVGIDHSTFYRWLIKYPSFNKRVMEATFIGKRAVCGTAEATIIKGVQNGDFKASTFYLTHNDPNYMQKDKGDHFSKMLDNQVKFMKSRIKYDGANFETLFKLLDELNKTYGEEVSMNLGKFMIEFFCNDDPQLIELCNASYEEWRIRKTREEAIKESFVPEEK